MYTYEQYIKDNILLSNSVVVKMLDTAIAINNGLTLKYEILPSEDKLEWKYFLNISGQKHFDNTDVMLTVIETNIEETLTLDLLQKYPYTKRELLKNGYYYNKLLSTYPNEILYIHGCMYPVDINKAISSQDGTILAYNPTLIQHNEYSLIKQLQSYITNFINRWYIKGYVVTDELYLPAFLAMLYSSLPAKVANIRLDNINSNEVHLFHLEHYFRSKLSIWDDIKILKYETIFWLYSNIEHLIKNVGKQTTLDKILLKIFEANNIGIGETLLRIDTGKSIDTINPYEYSFDVSDVIVQNKALNNSYTLNVDATSTVEGLVLKQIDNVEELFVHNKLERDKSIVKDVQTNLSVLIRDNVKTKTLDINNTKLFNINKEDIFKTILDYWIYNVKHNYYSTIIEYDSNVVDDDEILPIINFIEPNTNSLYLITPKEGLLMLIKLLFAITKQPLDTKLSKVYIDTVLEPDRDNLLLTNSTLFQDGYTVTLVKELYEIYPSINVYSKNPEEFNRYLTNILKYNAYTWILDSNSENMIVSANLKELNKRMTITDEYVLTDTVGGLTIDELLGLSDTTYNINNSFNLYSSLDALIYAFTGLSLDSYKDIKKNIKSYVNILNKLTSYTIQTVPTGSVVDLPISVYYNNTNILRSKKGVATVLDSKLYPYEDGSDTRITGIANNFTEKYSVTASDTPTVSVAPYNKIVEGVGYIDYDLYNTNHEPVMIVDVMNEFIYDILDVEDYDNFILDLQAKFIPYEDGDIRVDTESLEDLDNLTSYWVQHVNPTSVTNNKIVEGIAYINNDVYNINNINTVVDVMDEFVSDILDLEDHDNFILNVNSKFTPYEDSDIRLLTDAREPLDDKIITWVEHINPSTKLLREDVVGVGLDTSVDDTYDNNTINDNIIIEIEDV